MLYAICEFVTLLTFFSILVLIAELLFECSWVLHIFLFVLDGLPFGLYTDYESTPMQYTAIFHGCKNDNFQLMFFLLFFHIIAQNIDCGYMLK